MLSRDEFAQAVLVQISQLDPSAQMQYDADDFALVHSGGRLRLRPWYATYAHGEQHEAAAVSHAALSFITLPSTAIPSQPVDESRILPQLRSRAAYELDALRLAVQEKIDPREFLDSFALRPLNEHLLVVLAQDHPEYTQPLARTDLDWLGLTFDEALRLALQNLQRIEPMFERGNAFERKSSGWWSTHKPNPYNSAWLLFPDSLTRMVPVHGQPVAFAPFEHALSITGTDDHQALKLLAERTFQDLEKNVRHDKPLLEIPLVLEAGQWQPWLPPESHPAHGSVKKLWCLQVTGLYTQQTLLLKQKYAADDSAPFVAKYVGIMVSSQGGSEESATSCSVWSNIDTLLPKTDYVELKPLLNPDDAATGVQPRFGQSVYLPWEEFARELGPRLRPQNIYPERYLVLGDDFPQGSVWERLKARYSGPPSELPAEAVDPRVPLEAIVLDDSDPRFATPIVTAANLYRGLALLAFVAIFPLVVLAARAVWLVNRTFNRPTDEDRQFAHQNFPPLRRGSPVMPPIVDTQENIGEDSGGPPQPLGPSPVELPRLEHTEGDIVSSGPALPERLKVFKDQAPAGAWLVGLRLSKGNSWGGAIRALTPIYQVAGEYHLGEYQGGPDAVEEKQFLARPGYAIGAIHCRAGLVLDAVQITFHRVAEGRLNPNDAYSTHWYGSPGGGKLPPLGGQGDPLVGIIAVGHQHEDLVRLQVLQALPKAESRRHE